MVCCVSGSSFFLQSLQLVVWSYFGALHSDDLSSHVCGISVRIDSRKLCRMDGSLDWWLHGWLHEDTV